VWSMDLNPNVLMDLAQIRNQEMLVAAQRARLARSATPERHSPLEPPTERQLARTIVWPRRSPERRTNGSSPVP
jgi:hypothetical protein